MILSLYRVFSKVATLFIPAPVVKESKRKTVWFHMASIGEVTAASHLIKLFLNNGFSILATVFTKTGAQRLHNIFNSSIEITRFPYDKPSFVKKVFERKNIRAVLIMETELWPNLIHIGAEKVPVFLVNARISDKNFKRICHFKKSVNSVLSDFRLVFPQSYKDADKFEYFGLNSEHLVYAGNTKIDTMLEDVMQAERNSYNIPNGQFTVTFGSIRTQEEAIVVGIIPNLLKNGLGVILAPRHLSRIPFIIQRMQRAGIPFVRYTRSKYVKGSVFLIDTIGKLKDFYSISDACFVGGTLGNYGGHNVLEPAMYAKPVIFGPSVSNIKAYAMGLIKGKGGLMVHSGQELSELLIKLAASKELTETYGSRARNYLDSLTGASSKIHGIIMQAIGDL